MRQIKFRAWSKTGKTMHPSWMKLDDENGEYTIMQFTGLLDKNSKEIYEGDIFNCIYHRYGHINHKYYVIYSEILAAFILQRVGNPCPQLQVHQTLRDVARYEIIGNIYENHELIRE